MDARVLLSRHYLFRSIDEDVVKRLAALATTRRLSAGEALFLKGDEGDALYGVLAGKIRISTSSAAGKEVVLNIMEPGDVFGEIALLDGNPRTADATAVSTTDLVTIRRSEFMTFLEREPRLAIHLLKLVCGRVRWASERIEDDAFLDVQARLAKRLLSLADHEGTKTEHGVRIANSLSQSELGQMLGTSRESVNKHLQRWRGDGWIDFDRRHFVIRNRAALDALVRSRADD